MKTWSALVLAAAALLVAVAGVWLLSGDEEFPKQPSAEETMPTREPDDAGTLVASSPARTPIPDVPKAKKPPPDVSQVGTHVPTSRTGPVEFGEVPYTGIQDPRAARIYEIYQRAVDYIRKKYPDPKTRPANQSYLLAVKEAELTLMNEQRFYYFGDSKLAPNMADLPPRTSERYFIMTARSGLTIVFELHSARFPGAFAEPASIARAIKVHEAAKKKAHMENRNRR